MVIGSVVAAFIALLFCLMFVISSESRVTYTWGIVLLPVLGGFGISALIFFYETALQRLRRSVVIAVCVLAVVGFSLGMALVFAYGNPHPLGEASAWWLLTGAIGLGCLAAVLYKLLPHPSGVPEAVDDDAWRRRVAGDLRLRAGMTEERVRSVLAEAEAKAAGKPLREQLGAPESYARRFPRDRRAERNLKLWFWTAMVPLTVFLALAPVAGTGWDWSNLPWYGVAAFAIAATIAVTGWARRLRIR